MLSGVKVTIPTFSGCAEKFENYQFSLRAYLGVHGALEKLDNNNLSVEEDRELYHLIATSLNDDAIATIRQIPEGCGAQAYAALCDRYASARLAAKYSLIRRLMSTKCPGSENLETWLDDMNNTKRKLEGMQISWEEVLILSAIDNLPTDLRPVGDWCLAAEAITFGQLRRVLIEKKDASERAEYQESKCMAAETSAGTAPSPFCICCGEKGHWMTQCSKMYGQPVKGKGKGKGKGKSTGKGKDMTRYNCGKSGHMAYQCKMTAQVAGASVAQLLKYDEQEEQ